MKKILIILIVLLLTIIVSYIKNEDCITSEIDAIELAKSEWVKAYGKQILKKKPFVVVSHKNNVWHIEGTLHTDSGGVPHIKIRSEDCKIIEIYHTK